MYEEGLPNIWGNKKSVNISPYMRRPLVIYDLATAPLWISLYMRKIWFSFLSVWWSNTASLSVTLDFSSVHRSQNDGKGIFWHGIYWHIGNAARSPDSDVWYFFSNGIKREFLWLLINKHAENGVTELCEIRECLHGGLGENSLKGLRYLMKMKHIM